MKNWFASLLILISFNVIANESVYDEVNIFQYLKKDQLKMTPFRYRAYIRPQLRSIRSEYYQVVNQVRGGHGYLNDLKQNTNTILQTWNRFLKECEDITENCLQVTNRLYEQVHNFDIQVLELQARDYKSFKINGNQFEEALQVHKQLDHISTLNAQIMHALEYIRMLVETPYLKDGQVKSQVSRALSLIQTRTEVLHTALMPPEYRMLFDLLWRNFISPIDKMVLTPDDPTYLMVYLERLNYGLNEFRMRFVSGQFEVSESNLQLIQTLHRRWNTILRILIRDIED